MMKKARTMLEKAHRGARHRYAVDNAQRFYERHGLVRSPIDPMMLMITLADVERELSGLKGK